jgi:carbonic anhydrase/acetyltransferase-like protein (isoleucine patch superfamily)
MINAEGCSKIVIIGYPQATISQEFLFWIGQEFSNTKIVEPKDLVLDSDTAYIISVTQDEKERLNLTHLLQNSSLATFLHDTVIQHANSKVGRGTWVGPSSSLYFDCAVGDHCIVGPYSMISHKTRIGNNNIIHPATMFAGSCNIGNNCLFGIRSTIIDKITICDNVQIGAGSLVSKDIVEPGDYVGFPCRKSLK